MIECDQSSFPLTVAQRGLWFSQKIHPDALMNIAEAVEICGPVKPEVFQQALHRVISEAEQLRVSVIEEDGKPLQVLRSCYEGDLPYIDMSREPDPRAASEAWMRDELRRPVDLAHDPLWTSALLKVDDNRYFWYQRAHHIVHDGYGGGLVARRVAEVYTAYIQGEEPAPNRFCTVREMIEAETRYRSSDRFRRDREYWLEHLARMPEAVTLSRRNCRHELSSSLQRSTGHLPAAIVRQLAELGKQAGASLPQVLIGWIAAYYHRMTGAEDLVFRMPVSGRLNPVLRSSVGVEANMVPVRLSFIPETTAADLFAQVSRVVLQALRHQQYRYEELRRDLGLFGQEQNIAWLGVNIEPFDYRLNFDGAETITHNLSNSGAEDLTVFVYDRGTETDVRFDLDANPDLYSMAELDEHRRRLMGLVEQLLAHPDKPLRQLDILGQEERRRLLVTWNNTARALPYISLPTLVEQWAQKTPDAPAVVFGDAVVTYRQLNEYSTRYARHLLASGIKPGDIVAVALPRNEQLLMVLLGIMRAGASYLPLDLDGPIERMLLVLADASPAALIAQAQVHMRLASGDFLRLLPELPDTAFSDTPPAADLSSPDDVVYVLYTSGSTGKPKGVEVTHRNLWNFLEGMQVELKPKASDRFLAITTLIFDIAGLELYLPLTVGACVVMGSSDALRNPPVLARLVQRSGVTHMQATPSLWRILLANSKTKIEHVHALVGGEALSAELAARLKSMAARVTQFYGPTETTIWSTAQELKEVGDTPPPIGRPILNTQLYVLDENQQLVATGVTGELYIGGEGVAKGYHNKPELTAMRFLPDPFAGNGRRMYRTGDLVRWNEDGELEFIGRADNQVKINGHRVELGEIESVLLQHAIVAEAAVTAHRNDDGVISLHAYLVPLGGRPVDISSVRLFLASRLPNHMMPASFTVLDAMPLTPNGKLDRKALPVPERAITNIYVEPVTPTEKKLAQIWRQILKVERVGLHDNFFDLGGDSLSAAEFIAHFHACFDMELPMGSLFEAPTVASLAAMVERLSSADTDPLGVVLPLRKIHQTTHRPLFCIHPMAGLSLGFSSLLRHLSSDLPVYGLQSRGLRGGHLPSSIEEIADDYLEQIRRIQPRGPYRLLGRSLGGLIAHCIAGQMELQELEVELLAMIDSFLFLPDELSRPLTESDEVKAALSFMNIHFDEEKTQRTLRELGEFLLSPDQGHPVPLAYQGMMRMRQMVMKNNPEFLENLTAVMLNNLKLARQYRPSRVGSGLLYFRATEMTGKVDDIIHRSPSAWQPFVGNMEVHDLACHHEAVLDPGPAAQMGKVLQQRFVHPDVRQVLEIPRLVLEETGESSAAYA
ncbi:MAG TPA: amino acid adenylation domain-containing protein [Pseudacidobacterium sp.]|nr:amino acid adenylation domain-containing protein [Pseudacidobacterium sp.]